MIVSEGQGKTNSRNPRVSGQFLVNPTYQAVELFRAARNLFGAGLVNRGRGISVTFQTRQIHYQTSPLLD